MKLDLTNTLLMTISVIVMHSSFQCWIVLYCFLIQIVPVFTLKNTKIYQPVELTRWNISTSMEVCFSHSPIFKVTPTTIITQTLSSTSSTIRLENSPFIKPLVQMEGVTWNILQFLVNITLLLLITLMELQTDWTQFFIVRMEHCSLPFKTLQRKEEKALIFLK